MTKVAVIFGGSGFIGRHFTFFLLNNQIVDRVISADLRPIDMSVCSEELRNCHKSDRFEYHEVDVRNKINLLIDGDVNIIANFAAVHREPGHAPHEYYETNIPGAENVCSWGERVGCERFIFTSSISPYGPTEEPKNEESIPTPVTAYGGSKLAAEKIHEIWQAKDAKNRRLIIVRPGVVFGPGEGGNVSRLIKAVLGRYFVYMGNQQVRKAGTYVKELCHAMIWVLDQQRNSNKRVTLFNMSMNPGPTIQEYVKAVCLVADVNRWIPALPFYFVYWVSVIIDPVFRLFGIQSFSPVRIQKLIRSNNIEPKYLVDNGYPYHYSLNEAFDDWRKDMPEEW